MLIQVTQWAVDLAVKKIKENRTDWRFEDLKSTSYLYGSSYLSELLDEAKTKDERMIIFEHIHQHYDILLGEVDSYNVLQESIIDRYRRD